MSRHLQAKDVITIGSEQLVVMTINVKRDELTYSAVSDGRLGSMSVKDLRKKLAAGDAVSNAPATIRGSLENFRTGTPSSKKFIYNTAVVERIRNLTAVGHSKRSAIHTAQQGLIKLVSDEQLPMCSLREAYRLLNRAENTELALAPNYSSRGNRERRYPARVEEILMQLIAEKYAIPNSPMTIMGLTETLNQCAHDENVVAPKKNISRKYVRTFLINNWNPDLEIDQLHSRIKKSLKAIAKDRIRPGAPLNRVEMDTLHLPFVAKDAHGLVEELYVMMAIDCETSHPLSWWFMKGKPSTEDSFSCLTRAIFPKDDLFKKLDVTNSIDPFGAPLNLVLDNGSENSKIRLANLVHAGISPRWAKKDSGHEKPFIERLNRSLKEALERLPGCTRANGEDGKRTAEAKNDDLMSVEVLERWIVRWLFEEWVHQPLDRFVTADYEIDGSLGITPTERWKKYESMYALPLSPPWEKWRRVRFLEKTGSLTAKTGISFENFDFRGQNLPRLVHQYGPNVVVKFYYNPHDYRTIYVADKQSDEWIELRNTEVKSSTPAYSFEQAKARRKEVKATYEMPAVAKRFKKDYIDKTLEKRSKKQRKDDDRIAAFARANQERAILRAASNPLFEAEDDAPPCDTFVSLDAIRTFETRHKTEWPVR